MDSHTGFKSGNRIFVYRKHRLIHLFLPGRETSAHGHSAGAVAGIIGILGTEVHQKKVAIFHHLVILDIMQNTGIGAGGHDGSKGVCGTAVAQQLVRHSCLHLIFITSGGDSTQGALEHFARDVACVFHGHQLLRGLHRAQRVENGGQPAEIVQRIIRFELPRKTHLMGRIVRFDARILRNMQIDMLGMHHQIVQHTLKLIREHHRLHTTQFGCLLFAQAVTEPNNLLRRGILDEENLPVGRVGMPWRQRQISVLLIDTTEVQQVGILAKGLCGVTAARIFIVGYQHGDGIAFQLAHHIFSVSNVKLRR